MRIPGVFAAILLVAGTALAATPTVKSSVELRLRSDGLDTPVRNAATDSELDLGLARFRAALDVAWNRWRLRGMTQAVAIFNTPETRGGDNHLQVVAIGELYGAYETDRFKLVLGRQPYVDGAEVAVGIDHLDAVKERRLTERMAGTLDWPNTGRRFDGVSAGYLTDGTQVSAFAFRPLVGSVDLVGKVYDMIEGVALYGATVTGRHGRWIPGTEVRIFTVQLDDRRRPGADRGLSVNTSGVSFLVGDDASDLLLWGAVRNGHWGSVEHDAWAFLADVGHRFEDLPGEPDLHVAWEESSGDPRPGADGVYFELWPWNYRYYGAMDYLAFQNLRDAYAESLFKVGSRLRMRATVHDFALTKRAEVWDAGSLKGVSFGFPVRAQALQSRDLARELDLEATWELRSGFKLGIGAGHWWGGDAAEVFFPTEKDGTWMYLQLGWKK